MRSLQKYSRKMIYLIYLAVLCGTVGADQLTKALAVKYLKPVGEVPLWQGVFHFTYVENPGMAFGMLKDHRWVFMTVSVLGILLVGAYLFWYGKSTDRLTTAGLLLIMGGGIGNMIDRVALGYVVDFFDFTLIDFAVFNVADSFVCIGAGLIALGFILTAVKEKKSGSSQGQKENEAPHV